MTAASIDLTLQVWRQQDANATGRFERYEAKNVSTEMSFLEMLDVVNETLTLEGKDPIAFDSDCREGICGQCGCMVNGQAHGHEPGTCLCQLHMRHFQSGDTIVVEPYRARAFPIVKDLMVDRSALDTIIQAGGYVSVNVGGAPDANALPIPQRVAEQAMDSAACIGCGACVASCPNASAMLFTGAKVSQLSSLPQGRPEAATRAFNMVRAMDAQGFGNCSNEKECEAACPKNISIENIARLNRAYLKSALFSENAHQAVGPKATGYSFEPIYGVIPEEERAALSQHFRHEPMGEIALEWAELMRETFQDGHEIVVFKIHKQGAFIGLGIMSIIRHLDPGKYVWRPVASIFDLVAKFDVGFVEVPVSNIPGVLTVKGIDAAERAHILQALCEYIWDSQQVNVLCAKVDRTVQAASDSRFFQEMASLAFYPNTVLDFPYSSFDEFSTSALTRKKFRKCRAEKRALAHYGGRVEICHDLDSVVSEVYGLYKKTGEMVKKKPHYVEMPLAITKAFYENLSHFPRMRPAFALVKVGQEIIAYSLLLQSGKTLFFKAVGMEYELSYKTKAYFNLYYASLD